MSDTDFKAVPMQLEEARYSYRNSQQISSQTGLIGYLRADMGTNGNEFWSTWNDYRKDLKTDDFKSEFDDVINSFREKGQFLSDRQTLSRFCDDSQNALEFGERYGAGRDYGVRVNTQDYAYLMRLNPHKGEYNLYCYCYRKDWLSCFVFLMATISEYPIPTAVIKTALADISTIVTLRLTTIFIISASLPR